MKRYFKRFLSKFMLLVVIFEFITTYSSIDLNAPKEAKAFLTQMDSIAPGYVIKSEGGGITFDLSSRLSNTMTVESFSVKNTNNSEAKEDLPEERVVSNGSKWISKDKMIKGHTYEITAVIFDNNTKKNLTYVNTFKYMDRNENFNPDIKISEFNTSSISGNYLNSIFIPQDIVINLNEYKEIINNSKDLKLDILNTDFSKKLGTIDIDKNLIKNGYTISIDNSADILEGNKDYILRVYNGSVYWDKLFSVKLKSNPKIYEVYKPTESAVRYSRDEKTIYFDITKIKIDKSLWNTHTFNFVLSNDNLGFKPVERRGTMSYETSIKVPDEYYTNSHHPSTLKFVVIGPYNTIVAEYTFQITFLKDNRAHVWDGLELNTNINGGYKVEFIKPISNDLYTVPHSWDGFPKAHYITLYDNSLTKKIGDSRFTRYAYSSKFDFLNHKFDVSSCNFKIDYKDMRQGFNSFDFKVESNNSYKDWAYAYIPFSFYADILEIKSLEFDLSDISFNTVSNKYDFTIKLKNQDISVQGNHMYFMADNAQYLANGDNYGNFRFKNVSVKPGGRYRISYHNIGGLVYFNSIDASLVFNPSVVGTNENGNQGIELTLDKKYESILNSDNKKNILKILYMNGNSTGNEFSDFGIGTKFFKLNNSLSSGENYLLELSNSQGEVFKTTFEYTPLKLDLESATGTTAKLNWEYPNNYLIMDGDTLNIYLKKEGLNYSSLPDVKIIHGFQNINFNDVRTYIINNLSPNMNYKAKLDLVTNQGIKYSSEIEFVTSTFRIMNEIIEGMSDNGIVQSKNIKFMWDINQGDIPFSEEDKIDVFLKPLSHDAFPKTPEVTIDENINRVKSVDIKVQNYYESYSVKAVYTIGGTRHPSKILNFTVEPEPLEAKVSNITDSSSELNWEYPGTIEVSDNQEVRLHIKSSSDLEYTHVKTFKQSEFPLSENKKYLFSDLKGDTFYKVKVDYKVGDKTVAGVNEEIVQSTELEFKTKDFSINNFKVERIDQTKIKLKWDVSNKDYKYTENKDSISVFVKEKSSSSYPGNPSFALNTGLKDVTSCELNIDKYETDYDIKVLYNLKDKDFPAYTSYIIKVNNVKFNIDSIEETKVKVSWEYPKDYLFKDGDIVKLDLMEEDGQSMELSSTLTKTHSSSENLGEFNKGEFDLVKEKKYAIKFTFIPKGLGPREETYNFKAISGFQMTNIKLEPLNSASVKLDWEFYPKEYKFSDKDKVEIFYKESSGGEENFEGVNPVLIKSDNLDNFNSFEIGSLDVNKEYLFRVKYTLSNNGLSFEVYEDINGKPEYGKFKIYVVDTGVTGAKFEVNYPENYEKEKGNILDIFIKLKDSVDYNVKPNFSAVHGSEEGEFDLNEVSVLDILGLSPGSKYMAKAVFWHGSGSSSKHESEVEFVTGEIKGIKDIVIGDVIDHIVKVGVKMDPEEVILSSGDSCKVYIKKSGEADYPSEPSGESGGDIFNEDKFVSAYFDELNATYDVKVILNIAGTEFKKEGTFTNKIDNLNAELKDINPMTAQIEWRYPKNYTLVDGESVKIYTKFKEDKSFPETPDVHLIQSSEKDISNINLVEIYSLIPETEYEIKVELNLLEAKLDPVVKEFKTEGFEVKDLNIRDSNSKGVVIEWKLSDDVEFIDEYDNLSIFVKGVKDEDYNYDKPVAEFTKGLGEIRTASFPIENKGSGVDIMVSYLIDNYETYGEITFSPLSVNVNVEEEGVKVSWSYPKDAKFKDGDRLDLYLKHSSSAGYRDKPHFRYTNGEDGDLIDLNEIFFKKLEEGEYKLKFSLITSDMLYSPIELEFNVGGAIAGINGIPLKVDKILDSKSISFKHEGDVSIDYEEGYSIDPDGLELYIDEDESIIITKIVPGKEYNKIVFTMVDENGEDVTFVANDVLTEPATLLEGFITNIYKFAFERYPDESGYDYWLNKLLEKKEVTGKFVLYNLMFAEREFSDRNLPDDELIKVLYQIVVNREYDEGGLNFWIGEYNNTYLPQANNDSYEAQKAIVTRMLYEQEFRNLCEKMGILW